MNCVKTYDNSILENKGFSVVELVITVMILSIATAAIMKAFSLGSRYNSRAQRIQEATSIAESTMEEIKRLSIDGLETKYGSGSAAGISVNSTGEELCLSANSIDLGLLPVVSKNTTSATDFPYYILNRKDVTIGQGSLSSTAVVHKYQVIATIKAAPYGLSDNALLNANSLELPKIDEVDESEQVVLSTEINQYDGSAYGDLDNQYSSTPAGLSTNSITKNITIKLEDGSMLDILSGNALSSNSITATCNVEYTYDTKSVIYNVYSGSFSNSNGGNIYLFYKHSGMNKDVINIEDSTTVRDGSDGEKVSHNIYFVEQDTAAAAKVLGTDYDIKITNGSSGAQSVPASCMSSFSVTDGGRKNMLYTNLSNDGSNIPLSGNNVGHLYEKKANKNNIYQIEVFVLDQDSGELSAGMTSTKSGDWQSE